MTASPFDAAAAPDPKPVPDGTRLLDNLSRCLRCYVVATRPQADVNSLWAVHTHANSAFDVAIYLHVRSPQKGCGK